MSANGFPGKRLEAYLAGISPRMSEKLFIIFVSFFYLAKEHKKVDIDLLISKIPYFEEHVESKGIPGLGIVVIVLLVCLAGWLVPILLSTPLAGIMHRVLNSTPLVGVVYSPVKDLMSAFVGKNKKFGTPVLVSLDADGVVQRLGFITSEDTSRLKAPGKIAVYMPSSYGLLGDLVIVPTDKVERLDENSADVMKFIVSGGVSSLDETGSQDNQKK